MNIFHTQTEMTPVTGNKRAMTIMEASSLRTLIYSQTVRDGYSGDEDSDGYPEEEYEEDLEETLYEDTGGWSGVNQYKY